MKTAPCFLLLSLVFLHPGIARTPILEFKFNTPQFRYDDSAEPGSGALSTGTSFLKLGFRNGLGGGPPRGAGQTWFLSGGGFYSTNQGGVSGLDDDWAYQNDTAANDMGDMDDNPTNNQGAAIAEGVDEAIAGLESMTLCGWFYVRGNEPLQNFARLVSNLDGGSGFELRGSAEAGVMEFRLNEGAVQSSAVFDATGEWQFFAVTYDSLETGEEVQFYVGGVSESVAKTGATLSLNQGPVGVGKRLTIGNAAEGGTRSFSGNFDNIRVYGEVLSPGDLEAVRLADLSPQVNLPLPPSSLIATVRSSSEVLLEWVDNSDDESYFEVTRFAGDTATTILLEANTTSYVDADLTPETGYTYTVQSGVEEGKTPATGSVTVSTPPVVSELTGVANILVSEKSPIEATIVWEDVSEGEAGFVVEKYNSGSSSWATVMVLPADSEQARLAGLSNADLQRFRVYSFNGVVESEATEIVFELRDRESSIGGIEVFEIDETLVTRTIYVDPVNGSDANDGSTLANPKRTITSAFSLAGVYNHQGEGTRIILQPGIYQEGAPEDDLQTQAMISIGAGSWANPGMPIILEGAGWDQNGPTGDVIVQGSNRYTDWTPIGDNVYEHSWTIDWGVDPSYPFPGSPVGTRSFHGVNVRMEGERYWEMYPHMEGPDDPNIANIEADEGYFWVDEDADYIRVKAPEGVDLTDPSIEVNVNERHRLFHYFQATDSDTTNPNTPLVIRNIVFRHGYRGPFLQNVGGAIVEDCSFENTKLFGFSYDGSFPGFVLRRCDFIRNGHSGGGIDGIKDGQSDYLMEELFFLENGRQATVTGFRGHFESQIKLADMNGATFRDFHMVGAEGVGLWLDTGLSNFEAYSGVIEGGITAALFIENHNRNNIENLGDQLTVYVRDLWLRDGRFDLTQNTDNTKGLQTAESENWIADNLWIEGQARPFNFAYNNRGDLFQNTIKNTVAVQVPTLPMYYGETETWGQAFDTFIPEFDGNRYYGGAEQGFLGRGAQYLTFAEWVFAVNNNPSRVVSGIEENSLWFQNMDDARPTLGAYPTSREMSEGEGLAKGILITRLGAAIEAPLTVDLVYSTGAGNTNADDFQSLPDQVTIPAGSISTYLPLRILHDRIAEGLELFEVQVLPQGDFEVLTEPARVNVVDLDSSDLPTFKATGLGDRIFENVDEPVLIRVLREGILELPVSLEFVDVGTAELGQDYTVSPESFTFESGDYEQIIEIRPLNDSLEEGLELIDLELRQASTETIVIAAPSVVSIPLNDNDGVIEESVTVSVTDGVPDSLTSSFTIANNGGTAIEYNLEWGRFSFVALDSADAGGPDTAGFVDISDTGTRAAWNWFFPNDDGFSTPIELPWEFSWFGESYSVLSAHSNGFIVFGTPENLFTRYADPGLLPMNSTSAAANMLALAWSNLRLDADSALLFEFVEDVFIIQWNDFLLGNDRVTFQVQFEEGSVATVYYRHWPLQRDLLVGYQDSGKQLGSTIIPFEKIQGTPYALELSATVPLLNSATESVFIEPGATEEVSFNVSTQGLTQEGNSTLLGLTANTGHAFDQRLPVNVELMNDPAISDFGDAVLRVDGEWVQIINIGWLYKTYYPYFYSSSLGWLYKFGGKDQYLWRAFEWDSGWFYAPPSLYPYAYFYGSDSLNAEWGYMLTDDDKVRIGSLINGEWVSLPRG